MLCTRHLASSCLPSCDNTVRRRATKRDAFVKRTQYTSFRRWVSPHLLKKRRGEFDDEHTNQGGSTNPAGDTELSVHFAVYAHRSDRSGKATGPASHPAPDPGGREPAHRPRTSARGTGRKRTRTGPGTVRR